MRVRRLQAVGQFAVVGVERHAAADELAHGVRALEAEDSHRVGITQTGPGNQSVGDVFSDGVVLAEHHRDAALGEAGVAGRQVGLRQKRDLVARVD